MSRRNAKNYRQYSKRQRYSSLSGPTREELELRKLASEIRDQLVHERITRQLQEEVSDLEQRQEDQA